MDQIETRHVQIHGVRLRSPFSAPRPPSLFYSLPPAYPPPRPPLYPRRNIAQPNISMEVSVVPYFNCVKCPPRDHVIKDGTFFARVYTYQFQQLAFHIKLSLRPNTHARCTLFGQQRIVLQRKILSSGESEMGLENNVASNYLMLSSNYVEFDTTLPKSRSLVARDVIPYNTPGWVDFSIEIEEVQIMSRSPGAGKLVVHPGPFNAEIPIDHAKQVGKHLGIEDKWKMEWVGPRQSGPPKAAAKITYQINTSCYVPFGVAPEEDDVPVKQEVEYEPSLA
ncbi:hypothetical protein QCA50_019668 [Cerrena zonata]|uniref:Arrestin-like N-terminal domain-containing protein n=1 Tax=Cerrena zonata TaxID=2478898 RepID=A0AAW0FA72_9APHY